MDSQQKELSLKFSDFLCDVIGTKQVVNIRRQIFAAKDHCNGFGTLRKRVVKLIIISSGSKAEGLDLKGSDLDEMWVVHYAQVFEQLDHVKNSDTKLSLIMDTENVKPGFTKLWVLPPQRAHPMYDCIDWKTGRPYSSSTLFLQTNFHVALEIGRNFYIHGPCTSTSDGMYDQATCLYCADWISQVRPWITRTKYSWASDEVIRNIMCSGVHFVPIGSKGSPYTDLEWRISFSFAEKQLIFCFNHIQLLCYALLKIILKDIIKNAFGDLLCSYFMKTIMFWLCEETDVALWRKENMILCFMTCFRRLIYCVENETCLHYFLPENSFFENRFKKQHHDLLSMLHGLYDLGWTCLLLTETLQSFTGYLEPQLLSNISLSTFLPILEFNLFNWNDIFDDTAMIKRCISKCIRSKTKKGDFYMHSLSRICQNLAQKRGDEESVQGNYEKYRNLRRSLSNLLIGVNHDAVSGWLLLASFFFTNKQYNISKILIDHSLAKFTPERCELYGENNLWQLRRYVEIQNIIGLRCLKNYTISPVMVRTDSRIIPGRLESSVMNESFLYSPSMVYAHALNCLYYQTVGDDRKAVTSYRTWMFYFERYNQYPQSK